jgi:hypothetical protein
MNCRRAALKRQRTVLKDSGWRAALADRGIDAPGAIWDGPGREWLVKVELPEVERAAIDDLCGQLDAVETPLSRLEPTTSSPASSGPPGLDDQPTSYVVRHIVVNACRASLHVGPIHAPGLDGDMSAKSTPSPAQRSRLVGEPLGPRGGGPIATTEDLNGWRSEHPQPRFRGLPPGDPLTKATPSEMPICA